VLCVAALFERKGIDVLLRALSSLSDEEPVPRVWIVGDGPERPRLERLAARLGVDDRVRFLGRRDDVADLLTACDVYVQPSRHEGLGVAALEAMAAGRPVVASRTGGLAESVVHERTGLLVPAEDPAALAESLARLLEDPALRKRLGSAGPERVTKAYSPGAMVEAYAQLYDEVLRERSAR
jgi:glycosyltransferase involved in cell wall biosynthesis